MRMVVEKTCWPLGNREAVTMQPRDRCILPSAVRATPLLSGHVRVDDPEEDNAVFELLYDYETVHLGRQGASREVSFAGTPAAAVYREWIGGSSHNLGTLRGDKIALCIPLVDTKSSWWGQPLKRGSLPISRSGQSIHFTYHGGHQNLVLAVDRSVYEAAWAVDGVGPAMPCESAVAAARQQLLASAPTRVAAWSRRLQRVLQAALQPQADPSMPVITGAGLQNEVLTALRSLLENGRVDKVEQPLAESIVKETLVRVDAAVNDVPSVADLCVALNVSRRTLEMAFQRVTETSPRQFLTQRQLNRSYCLLKQANPVSTRVTDVAMACGFHELGRFAGRFKQAFGESPRDTLHTRVGRATPKVLGADTD
jgi:AraC-like DNA-binding protein